LGEQTPPIAPSPATVLKPDLPIQGEARGQLENEAALIMNAVPPDGVPT
jgi:hypothetical protein